MNTTVTATANSINSLITLALKEDTCPTGRSFGRVGAGDITSNILISANHKSTAIIIAKEQGIIAGLGLIKPIYHKLSNKVKVTLRKKDGAKVNKDTIVAVIKGPTRAILTGERTVLNFLQRLSGIATLTNQFVGKVKGTGVRILDTRKTVPGWRALDKYAVKTGGGFNHRMGLYDAFLIKNNHISVLGGITKINMDMLWKAWLKDLTAEIEVRDFNQFVFIIAMLKSVPFPKVVIMLDNMAPSQIKEAVTIRNKTAKLANRPTSQTVMLEASGGITLKNISKFAATGVDYISIGALTHSPQALDIALRIT